MAEAVPDRDRADNPDCRAYRTQKSGGRAIFQTDALTPTLDYGSYELQDQITTVPANGVATAVAGGGNGSQTVNCASGVRYLITFNNSNACTRGVTVANDIARIRSDTVNGPGIKTTGIDADVDYRFDSVFGGEVHVGGNASYHPPASPSPR